MEGNEGKKVKVRLMFNQIAKKYDFLNHFLSFGIDHLWRKKVVRIIKDELKKLGKSKNAINILDLATGTGDLAIALNKLNPKSITGIDISENMLEIGSQKLKHKNITNIKLIIADAENTPFNNQNFDVATVAFGIRNFENLTAGLKETHRLLNKNGIFLILEFSNPENKIIKIFYHLYFHKILPFIGNKISKNDFAYTYLPESVNSFPERKQLLHFFENCGFKCSNIYPLTGGIATIYLLHKINKN